MSKLTFQIEEKAKLRAGERFSLAGLRAKLFGSDARKSSLTFQTIPSTRNYGQKRPAPVAAPRPSYFDAAPNDRPFTPAKTARPAFVPISPQPVEATQTVYKGYVIHAVRLEDKSWAAYHHPIGADPAIVRNHPSPTAQRYMARVLAIASAEIAIDDLEKA